MKEGAAAVALERLRRIAGTRLGLHLNEVDDGVLAAVLERCAEAGEGGVGGFLARLAGPAAARELSALASELTVGETYFFREPDQLRAFSEVVLAAPVARILSAGCASGEEAYTLAILARERSAAASVLGIDVNPVAIARARRGRYGAWALRQTPAETRARVFREVGGEWAVDDAIRQRVSFAVHNLVEDAPDLWRPGAFDVVFLRNVIMYFSREVARAVIARVTQALVPGGYLFLGHAESMRELSDEFELQNTHGAFYYRRRGPAAAAVLPFAPPSAIPTSVGVEISAPPIASAPPAAVVTEPPLAPIVPLRRPPVERPMATLARTLELLQAERFVEALESFASLPEAVRADRQSELVCAVLLTHAGRLADAETVCEALVAADDRDAGAHYLLALLREQAGELDAAVAEDRIAARLDPAFAMPHLHMGLLARRVGDRRLALRELAAALELLGREDPTRMLLFGGGFGREALVELCRAELRAAGGSA